MKRPALRPTAGPRGQITLVSLVLLLGLAAGAYLAFVWAPVWIVHYEVTQVVRDHMNQAVKNRDDSALVVAMTGRIRALEKIDVVGEDGRVEKRPLIDLRPEDVTWERDVSVTPPTLHVAFSYTRPVTYPWLDRVVEKTLDVDLSEEIDIPDWGLTR